MDNFVIMHSSYDEQKDFTSLICWKDARKVKLYFNLKILPQIPQNEKFNLEFQMRKALSSISANIAEGYGRFHYQEGLQFYRIARGSLYELKDHLITIYDLKAIEKKVLLEGVALIEKNKVSLNGFIIFVKNQQHKKVK